MSALGGTTSTSPITNNPQIDVRVSTPKSAEIKVGFGVTAYAGTLPDAPAKTGTGGSTNAVASLGAFTFGGRQQVDTEVLLVQVAVSMRDTEATSQKAKISTDQETKKAQAKEKEQKLEKAQEKIAEAAEKKNGASTTDKIKLAFEWLGAVLAIATAAVLIVSGVGTAVGVALAAAAVVAIVMAIDSTIQMQTGSGIAGQAMMSIDKMRNANGTNQPPLTEEQMQARAGKADMGFKIAMAVVGIALAIASGGQSLVNGVKTLGQATASMAQAGLKAAQTAEKGASVFTTMKEVASAVRTAYKTVMDVADKVADTASAVQKTTKLAQKIADVSGRSLDDVQKTAKMAHTYVGTAEKINDIAATGADVASSTLKYQATTATADAKTAEAGAKVDEAMMMMLDDMIDQALSRLMAASDRFNVMLDDITSSIQDRGNTMSRARFQG